MPLLALLIFAWPGSASAVEIDREKFSFLGWNKACSAAFAHYGYPALGEELAEEPVKTRVGTLTIPPGSEEASASWTLARDGRLTWDPRAAAKAEKDLKAAGYGLKGREERVRPDPIAGGRDLETTLRSTATFATRATAGWPGEGFRLGTVHYSPLATCALLVYTKRAGEKDFYHPVLIRVGNPKVRAERARAHVTNALLLLAQGTDAQSALEEATIAVDLDPDGAAGHYHRAALLSLMGEVEKAVSELEAAVKLEPDYAARAREDQDFESLRWHPRYKALTGR